MTTPDDVVAKAREIVANGEIYRVGGDWDGYVSVQEQAPYDDGRFGSGHVEHCGISCARVLYEAGGRALLDGLMDAIQYAPALAQLANLDRPKKGCLGTIDWDGGVSDHVVLVIGGSGGVDDEGYVIGDPVTAEWNTVADGTGRIYTRPMSLFTAFVMPPYSDAARPTVPSAAPAKPPVNWGAVIALAA